MSVPVLSPRAGRDLLNAVRWITRDNPAAAHALRDAVLTAVRRIGQITSLGLCAPMLQTRPTDSLC
jgi:toxin ParE1/3/4